MNSRVPAAMECADPGEEKAKVIVPPVLIVTVPIVVVTPLAVFLTVKTAEEVGFVPTKATLPPKLFGMDDARAMTVQALDWVEGKLEEGRPVVIAASATPDKVAALQAKLGRDAAGALVEDAVASIAEGLVARGVGRLVVAGGETSGAVVTRLGVTSLRIGPEIDPGVPWTFAEPKGIHLALKSGNFGARDFFLKAFDHG